MTVTITQEALTINAVNPGRLAEDLAAAGLPLPIWLRRTVTPFTFYAEFPDGTDPAALLAVLNAHDAGLPSTEQAIARQAAVIDNGAEDEARAIPDFVGWTPAEAQAWVQANVTDLPTAKTALTKLVAMVAAINARVFPHVRAERQLSGE